MAFEKPKYLSRQYAQIFQDASVVSVYHARPQYPDETFEILAELITDHPRRLLDVGCGIGNIARRMLPHCDAVDAVDFSEGMIRHGKLMPVGDDPRLRWYCSAVEGAVLDPPYSLITAGNSLGWFDLDRIMPRFASMLTPNGYLVVVTQHGCVGVSDRAIIAEYSMNQDFIRYDLIGALEEAGLFQVCGRRQTREVPWEPTVDEYLDFRHSQNGLSKDRLGPARAAAFDKAVRRQIQRQAVEGAVELEDGRLIGTVTGIVVWGTPCDISTRV